MAVFGLSSLLYSQMPYLLDHTEGDMLDSSLVLICPYLGVVVFHDFSWGAVNKFNIGQENNSA